MESTAGAGSCLIRLALLVSLLAIVGCSEPTDLVGAPSPAEFSDLEEAVRPAAVRLLEARGIEAVAVTTFDTGRTESRWVDYRSEGEYAEVEVVEFVGEGGDEGRTRITAKVVFAEVQYEAQRRSEGDPGSWTARERQPHEVVVDNPLSRMLPFTTPGLEFGSLAIGEYFEALGSGANDVTVTSQETSDGGSLWNLTISLPGAPVTNLIFGIHPDGYVRSFGWVDLSNSTTSTSLPEPAGRVSVESDFETLADPDPIQPPEPGTPLDLGRFDLPSSFPVG